MTMLTELSTLDVLEAEAVHVIRECAAECERPVLLFSGGKDSAVLLHLAVLDAVQPGHEFLDEARFHGKFASG